MVSYGSYPSGSPVMLTSPFCGRELFLLMTRLRLRRNLRNKNLTGDSSRLQNAGWIIGRGRKMQYHLLHGFRKNCKKSRLQQIVKSRGLAPALCDKNIISYQ